MNLSLSSIKKYLSLLRFREGILTILIAPIITIILWSIIFYFLKIEYYISIIIFISMFVVLQIVFNYILKLMSLNEIRLYKNTKAPEVAVVLGDDSWESLGNMIMSSYWGIRFLIKYLSLQNEKIRIYLEPTKNIFNSILKNKQIHTLYLIGHGSKRNFILNHNQDSVIFLTYKHMKLPKKQYIHLYHCTHSKENVESIIDYLVKKKNQKKCYIANDKISVLDTVLEFYKLYKSVKI